MKLLVTLSYYDPYISGLSICAKNLSEALAKNGYRVIVLASQHEKNLPLKEVVKRVSVIRVPFLFRISKGFFMPLYPWYAFFLVARSDLVMINLPQFEGFLVAMIARIFKKRALCVYHCEVVLPYSFFNTCIEYFLHGANTLALSLTSDIITYTEDFAKNSKILPWFWDKISFVYPPIPTPIINRKQKNILEKRIALKKKYMIGVAARVSAEKGFEYLFAAIPYLKRVLKNDFVIIIAGPKNPTGEKRYWKALQPFIQRYQDVIWFLGTVDGQEMGAFYSLIDVLVLSSINSTEAFGMVQVEAMLCGTPVVASNLPGVRVPIKKTGMGELAKPGSAKDLASKIVNVLKNRKQYLKPQSVIRQHFSFSRTINQYKKILTGVS